MVNLESGVGSTISSGGKTYLYFAGNDYLGLANHPALAREAQRAVKRYGVSVSASRITTGTTDIHLRLEEELAVFKGSEQAILFASGYLSNKLLLNALRDRYTAIFADSMSHPSISDGIPMGKVKFHTYDHCNTDHLGSLISKYKSDRKLIITDGIFPLTGEIAPLDKLYELALEHDAIIIVDDAHATGVLGSMGRGTPEYFNLQNREIIYQSETMSKAMGSYGGFIATDSALIDKIRSSSSFYGASTALPPAIVAASRESVKMIVHHPALRTKMKRNADQLRSGVKELGFETTETAAPIIPLYFKEFETASSLSSYLEENGIIAPNVKYPVKTHSFIVRATVSASHTTGHIDQFLNTLKNWRDTYGIG